MLRGEDTEPAEPGQGEFRLRGVHSLAPTPSHPKGGLAPALGGTHGLFVEFAFHWSNKAVASSRHSGMP